MQDRSDKIKGLCKEQFNRCAYCDIEMTMKLGYPHTATVDHVVPRSRGGLKRKFNEVAACYECNMSKGNMPIGDWLRTLTEKRHEKKEIDPAQIQAGYRMVGYAEGANPA